MSGSKNFQIGKVSYVSIYGMRAILLGKGMVKGQEYFAVLRDFGDTQIWTMDPPGLSDGFPRCVIGGTFENARAWWEKNTVAPLISPEN